ncbi:Oidioi.mRNA.OKI2018_I69.chr2.g5603.t1.cds [Oikopleura dioica]|uniref:Oidioi.mRNA.OKI2018_I69.chr2.g5603.t1.cds n=1 Tax=Oikopleura dioica TaxID=34765 RepID=A0ABN7T0Y5_OIKDI|nr:Oidioi.mRNA.OKI2018_I69.chr2.g5603.t1.cds [Oikopleura dioica]
MLLFSSFLLLSSAQLFQENAIFERKVPPRTPDQRLGTLQIFLNDWIRHHIGSKRINRSANWIQREFFGGSEGFDEHKLLMLYFKQDEEGFPSCSYYNPTNMNHAGPRLPSEPRHYERQANADLGLYDHIKIKKRKRRNASQFSQPEIVLDQLKLVARLPPNGTEKSIEHGFGRRNNDLIQLIRNREDFFDIYDLALELDRSMAALRKLSSDPRRSWSQIRMGFLKWIARYTADCKVERESQKHTVLIMEFFEKLMMLYECLYEGKTPPEEGRVATARVKFIYGAGTVEEAKYDEKLSFLIEPPRCSVNDHMRRVLETLRRRRK